MEPLGIYLEWSEPITLRLCGLGLAHTERISLDVKLYSLAHVDLKLISLPKLRLLPNQTQELDKIL